MGSGRLEPEGGLQMTRSAERLLLLVAAALAALTLTGAASPEPGRQVGLSCERRFGVAACRVLERPARRRSLPLSRDCGAACVAAYAVIARALPHDGDNDLAHAILATPGFSYARLDEALGVPSIHELEQQWRQFCRLAFTSDRRAVGACYRAISASPTAAR